MTNFDMTKLVNMTFGEYIKTERTKNAILQRELAAQLGVDSAYISKIENDEKIPKKELAVRIGKSLSLNLELVEINWLKQKLINQLVGEKYSEKAMKLVLREFLENKGIQHK